MLFIIILFLLTLDTIFQTTLISYMRLLEIWSFFSPASYMKLQEDISSDSFICVTHLNYSVFSCALLLFSYHLVFQREVCSLMEVEIHSLTAYTFLVQAFRSRRKEKANKFSIYYSFTLIWKSNHTGREDLKLVIQQHIHVSCACSWQHRAVCWYSDPAYSLAPCAYSQPAVTTPLIFAQHTQPGQVWLL